MRVGGILETALYVADIPRAADFYRRVFRFPTLFESDRLIALDVAGRNVLLLFPEGGTTEPFAVPGGIIPPTAPPAPGISPSRSRPRTSTPGASTSKPKASPSRAS